MMSEYDKEEKLMDNMYSNFSKGLRRDSPPKKDREDINDLRLRKARTTLKKFGKYPNGSKRGYQSMMNMMS